VGEADPGRLGAVNLVSIVLASVLLARMVSVSREPAR
jgi:hypothetical protein